MLRRLIGTSFYFLADMLGINALCRWRYRKHIRVLMYHGIEAQPPSVPCWTVLSAERFKKQIAHASLYYGCISTRQMVDVLDGAETPNDYLCFITFDDGLRNNVTVAEPILAQYHVTACCFVCPALSEKKEQIWADRVWEGIVFGNAGNIDLTAVGGSAISLTNSKRERASRAGELIEKMKLIPGNDHLSWMNLLEAQGALSTGQESVFSLMSLAELKEMADRKTIDVASHTLYHPILSRLPLEEQEREIVGCKESLERSRIPSYSLFAYPNGRPIDFSGDTIAVVKKTGFAGAFGTTEGLFRKDGDRYNIPRIAVGHDTSIWEFKAKMSGLHYTLKRVVS